MQVIGVLFILFGVAFALGPLSMPEIKPLLPVTTVMGLLLVLLGVFSIRAGSRKKKRDFEIRKQVKAENEKKQAMGCLWSDSLKHVFGLPLAENIACAVYYCKDKLVIEGGGTSFDLPIDRISDVSVITKQEIQKSYSSSIAGAVGGAVLFGPLGAMIGGRSKEKTSKVQTYYLIFTYEKDREINYLAFDVTGKFTKAQQVKAIFDKQPKTIHKVSL